MPTQKPSVQTVVILALTLGAVVGALVGAASALTMSTSMSIYSLFPDASMTESDQVIESKIIELIEEESATIAVVERVTPAVVSVVVKQRRGDVVSSSLSNSFYYNSLFGTTLTEEEADELIEVSSGTGFFVSEDGYVLTNRHVIDSENASFFVVNSEGEEMPAELIDSDPFQDIAILKVEGEGFEIVTLGDSEEIRIGQTVIAIGNTLSEFRNTVTKGVISGIDRRVTAGTSVYSEVIDEAIQTDAAINPGNSGGPLINLLGEVVGINTAVSYQGESVAFAIPINDAKRAIDDVKEYGKIVRPWLGVRYVLVEPEDSEDALESYSYDVGAMVISGDQPGEVAVFEGSPADLVGLKEGDVIISVGGDYMTTDQALGELISVYHPGDTVTIEVLRDTEIISLDVTLAEYGESL